MTLLVLALMFAATPPTINLWPAPKYIEVTGDHGLKITDRTPVVLADDATPNERAELGVLFDALGETQDIATASQMHKGESGIYVGEPGRLASLQERRFKRPLNDLTAPGPQGYRIIVTRNAVVVAGTDPAGTFYGLQTLAQLVKPGRRLPLLRISDEPSLPIRGALWQGRPDDKTLKQLAALTCNLLLFSSDDFGDLTPDKAAAWKTVFDEARRYHIEPVPMLRLLDGAQPLLKRHPNAAEGKTAIEHLTLRRSEWQTLGQRNVIDTPSCPISVTVSSFDCVRGKDFEVAPGILDPSFNANNSPWAIRRIPGGAIPDGATVDVTYTYVPPGTAALCPAAPETRAALRDCFNPLCKQLHARYIHIGLGAIQALNRDLRCAKTGATDADAFASLVTLADRAAQKANPSTRIMLWADVLNPHQGTIAGTLSKALTKLPKDVILTVKDPDTGPAGPNIAQTVAWCRNAGLPFEGAPGGDALHAYTWVRDLTSHKHSKAGIIYIGDAEGNGGKALKLALGKAWAESGFRLSWPEGLNDYFGAALWEPRNPDVIAALVHHLNRQTLLGVTPKDEFNHFQNFLKSLRRRLPEGDLGIAFADRIYRNLTDYLTIEAAYTEKRSDFQLRRLVKLIETQGKLDPDNNPDRIKQIVSRVRSAHAFAPSTVVFGPYLLPFRLMTIPAGCIPLEMPGTPTFHDAAHRATATFDFIASPGPICRIDFETAGTKSLTIERSDDARSFTPVDTWTSDAPGGLRAPIILQKPFQTRGLRIIVKSPEGQPVLRIPRVFALKEPTAITCAYSPMAPVLDASFKENAWPLIAPVYGFVRTDQPLFAKAQTTVRVVKAHQSLYFAIYAREPRMNTMVATMTHHDDPVWKEESCAIIIDTGASEPLCFAVNPLGTKFESRGGNPSWDGAWRAVCKNYTVGWAAEIAIPFSTLGATPQKGATWNINFVRTRYNVEKEESTWACKSNGLGDPAAYGRLTF